MMPSRISGGARAARIKKRTEYRTIQLLLKGGPSDVQVHRVFGVALDELLPGLHLFPMRMVKISSAFTASSRVIRRSVRFSGSMVVSPQLIQIHLAQALIAADIHLGVGVVLRISAETWSRSASEKATRRLAPGELVEGGTAE